MENTLKHFKRSCVKSGILAETRKCEHYESSSVRHHKEFEAVRKNRKRYY